MGETFCAIWGRPMLRNLGGLIHNWTAILLYHVRNEHRNEWCWVLYTWTSGQNAGWPLVESRGPKVSRNQDLMAHLWRELAPANVAGGNREVCDDEQSVVTGKQLKSTCYGMRASELKNLYYKTLVLLSIHCEKFSMLHNVRVNNFHLLGSKWNYFNDENKANYVTQTEKPCNIQDLPLFCLHSGLR